MEEMSIFEWLKEQGYEHIDGNVVELGGKKPDIIAFNDNTVMALEIKRRSSELPTALGQCLHYLTEANQFFIVLPKSEIKNIPPISLDLLRENGIGLLGSGKNIGIVVEAKKFDVQVSGTIAKIKLKFKKVRKKAFESKDEVKTKIIGLLEKHPEGLSISEIAEKTKMHRNNITKYVYELVGSGIIYKREIGPVKLCYLKDSLLENKSKGFGE
jgi:DNA-binding transcriptional ArsR family regulator